MLIEKDLEKTIMETMSRWDVPGMAVGIVLDGEIGYAKGFGVQSLETGVPVTIDSVFGIQSISKCFTATAVMQCAERGLLDLDAPLVQYLPYFRMDDEHSQLMTIRQALSHTSGMPDLDEFEYVDLYSHPEEDEGSTERFVRSLRDRKLVANPGERFSYSNIAYNVLGDLLAKVSGSSFENVMKERILLPAGMINSTFLPGEVPPNLLVVPHLRSPEVKPYPGYPYHRADAPASFLHATVVDMCRWALTSLKRGNGSGGNILSPAGYELMWTPVAKRFEPPSMYEQMGLGWNLGHFNGLNTISHGGAGFGGTAFLFIIPETNCAAVVLCNEESWACNQVSQAAAGLLTGQEPQPGPVSWMVPISQALAEGGISAARARVTELQSTGNEEVDLDPWVLDMLAIQLLLAKQPGMAMEVLELNIQVHPEHIDSYLTLGRLAIQQGSAAQGREILLRAKSIDPTNPNVAVLLERIDDKME